MNEVRSYIAPVGIGEVMRAGAVGRVVASKHPGFAVGDHVYGGFGVQEYALSKGDGVTKLDPSLAPLPVYLGALGMPGMTAYFGLLEIGKPKSGETVVVSGAAGAVGMVVGQLRGSSAAASSGSPAARRNAAISSTSSASMRPSTISPKTCARRCASIVRAGSMSISTMSAATFSTRRWPISRATPAS
jgi:NADPH-dependent curcumin reductase CurA